MRNLYKKSPTQFFSISRVLIKGFFCKSISGDHFKKEKKIEQNWCWQGGNMVCNCKTCKDWHEHCYWEHSHKNKVRFYKIMVGDFTQRVSMPQKFLAWCMEKLPEAIVLKGPRGDEWRVEVVKDENNVFLQSGWEKFVKAHQINENYTLFFQYDGKTCITVKIFDSSGCEMEQLYSSEDKHM